MGFFRQLFGKINTHMADLTASQRLAIGLCAVIIAGSLLWLMQWSATPSLVRLLEEPMTVEQMAQARDALSGAEYEIRGQYILVPPNDRHELFWRLQGAGALPADTSITFGALIADDSPFRPESENTFRRRVALQNELAKVVASSELVISAEVFITDTSTRRLNAPNVRPTASIKVKMAPGRKLDMNAVTACASLVAGAVPGLEVHNISVIDGTTLREYHVPDADDIYAQGQLDERKRHETHLQQKVMSQLSYIPGIRVAVAAQLDNSSSQSRDFDYSAPAVSEEKSMSNESFTGRPSGEPGVGPNVGQSLSASGGGMRDTTEESTTSFHDMKIKREVTTRSLPFAVVRTTASIGIPNSYIIGVIGKIKGTDEAPTQDEINQQFQTESARIRKAVKNIIMADADSEVTVDLFSDLRSELTLLPDGSISMPSDAAGASSFTTTMTKFAPQGVLVVMSFIAMMMLFRMASRSAKDARDFYSRHEPTRDPEAEDDEIVTVNAPAGSVQPSEDSMLAAVEIDEHTLRANQLAEQVIQLVSNDPEMVSSMLRRWTEYGD